MAKKKKKRNIYSVLTVWEVLGIQEKIKRSPISQDFYFNSIKALAPLP